MVIRRRSQFLGRLFLLNKGSAFAIFQAMSGIPKTKQYKSPARLLPKPNQYDYSGVLGKLGSLVDILKEDGRFADLKKYLNAERSPFNERLLFMYSILFEAQTLIVFFESMPKEDQQMEIEYHKILVSETRKTEKTIYIFEKLVADFKAVEKELIKFESENEKKMGEVLNLELQYKIAFWQGYVSSAMRYPYFEGSPADRNDDLPESDPSEHMESREDLCHERTRMEYFRLAIYWIGKLDPSRLGGISFFGEFEKRLEKLDVFLKWILKKPTRLRFYNDPSFWWSDKTYTFPQNTVAKDILPGEVSEEPIITSSQEGKFQGETKEELSEEVKNLFPVPAGLPENFLQDFRKWAGLAEKKYFGI